MFILSFQNAPLIGDGDWVGLDNYERLPRDRRFETALLEHRLFRAADRGARHRCRARHRAGRYIACPGGCSRVVLALFFLPYILPVSVVYRIWDWTLNFQFGIAMHLFDVVGIDRVPVFKVTTWFMPAVALRHDLVDLRVLDPAVPGRPAGDPAGDLRGGGARQCQPLDDLSAASPGRCSGRSRRWS